MYLKKMKKIKNLMSRLLLTLECWLQGHLKSSTLLRVWAEYNGFCGQTRAIIVMKEITKIKKIENSWVYLFYFFFFIFKFYYCNLHAGILTIIIIFFFFIPFDVSGFTRDSGVDDKFKDFLHNYNITWRETKIIILIIVK